MATPLRPGSLAKLKESGDFSGSLDLQVRPRMTRSYREFRRFSTESSRESRWLPGRAAQHAGSDSTPQPGGSGDPATRATHDTSAATPSPTRNADEPEPFPHLNTSSLAHARHISHPFPVSLLVLLPPRASTLLSLGCSHLEYPSSFPSSIPPSTPPSPLRPAW